MPGATISISLGYDNVNTEVFSGVVSAQRLRFANGMDSLLDVECCDKAIKLTTIRKCMAWSQSSDSDAISAILSKAGLSSEVAATSNTLPELVQYDVPDWDFIISRAEANGMQVLALNGKVTVFDPLQQGTAAATFTYGSNLSGFQGELNAQYQFDQIKASAWDASQQQLQSGTATATFAGPGNLSSANLSKALALGDVSLQTAAEESSAVLTSWAKAQSSKSALAKIIAHATVQGRSDLVPGKTVTLAGLGARFNGDHLVTGVRHLLRDGDWQTELKLGHEAHCRKPSGECRAGRRPAARHRRSVSGHGAENRQRPGSAIPDSGRCRAVQRPADRHVGAAGEFLFDQGQGCILSARSRR